MAIRVVRFVAIGLGQRVTLVADLVVLFLVVVVVYPAVRPVRSRRRFSASGSEVTLDAIKGKVMTGIAILLRLIAVIVGPGAVQPRLAQGMRHTGAMAVVAGIRVWLVPIGPGQAMALVARVDVALERLVLVIQAVLPTGTRRRLAARGAEMALAAPDIKVMTGGTILLGLSPVVVRQGTVQPCLAQGMRRAGTMAVMAGIRVWLVPIGLGQAMALVARVDVALERLVLVIQAVLPTGTRGRLAPRGAEVTLAAAD